MNYIEVLSFMQDPIPLAVTCREAFADYKKLMRRHKFGLLIDYLNGDINKYDTTLNIVKDSNLCLKDKPKIFERVIKIVLEYNDQFAAKDGVCFVFAGGNVLNSDIGLKQISTDLDIFVISGKTSAEIVDKHIRAMLQIIDKKILKNARMRQSFDDFPEEINQMLQPVQIQPQFLPPDEMLHAPTITQLPPRMQRPIDQIWQAQQFISQRPNQMLPHQYPSAMPPTSKDLQINQDNYRDHIIEYIIVKNDLTFNIIVRDYNEEHNIQLVLRKIESIEELLIMFDLNASEIATDGHYVYTTNRYNSFKKCGYNIVPLQFASKSRFSNRVSKYLLIKGIKSFFKQGDQIYEYDGEECPAMDSKFPNFYYDINKAKIVPHHNLLDRKKIERPEGEGLDKSYIEFSKMNLHSWRQKMKPGIYDTVNKDLMITNTIDEMLNANTGLLGIKKFANLYLLRKFNITKCAYCEKYRFISNDIATMKTNSRICPTCINIKAAQMKDYMAKCAKLKDKIILITGARIKIGYALSLICLRSGATVIATTRFGADALERYQKEPDYKQFESRLIIKRLNLLNKIEVTAFCQEINHNIDILINNAALTIKRPITYYLELICKEIGHVMPEEFYKLKDLSLPPKTINTTNPAKELIVKVSNSIKGDTTYVLERNNNSRDYKIEKNYHIFPNLIVFNNILATIRNKVLESPCYMTLIPFFDNVTKEESNMIKNVSGKLFGREVSFQDKVCIDNVNTGAPMCIINSISPKCIINVTCPAIINDADIHLNIVSHFIKDKKVIDVDPGWISSNMIPIHKPLLSAEEAAYKILATIP